MITQNDLDPYDKDVPFSAGRTPRTEKETLTQHNATLKATPSKTTLRGTISQKASSLYHSMKTGASGLTSSFGGVDNNRSRHVTFKDVLANENNMVTVEHVDTLTKPSEKDEIEVSCFHDLTAGIGDQVRLCTDCDLVSITGGNFNAIA